jgi:hypothetical protein
MAIARRPKHSGDGHQGTDPLVEFYVQLGDLSQKSGDVEQAEHAHRKALLFTVLYAGSGYDRSTRHQPTLNQTAPGVRRSGVSATR